MNERSHHNTSWNYFLALEGDIERVARYIELNEDNFKTYSIELARLLMASCAEIDVIFKGVSQYISPGSTANNITDYRSILFDNYLEPNLTKITCPRYRIDFKPFSCWSKSHAPDWWTANNKIKHKRDTYFHLANLGNCLNAIAALFWLNIQSNHHTHCTYAKSFGGHLAPPELKHTFSTLTPPSTLFQLNEPWLYFRD